MVDLAEVQTCGKILQILMYAQVFYQMRTGIDKICKVF